MLAVPNDRYSMQKVTDYEAAYLQDVVNPLILLMAAA
jgi:hypothetical protein